MMPMVLSGFFGANCEVSKGKSRLYGHGPYLDQLLGFVVGGQLKESFLTGKF
jgi:hypothetical protein